MITAGRALLKTPADHTVFDHGHFIHTAEYVCNLSRLTPYSTGVRTHSPEPFVQHNRHQTII